LALVARIQRDIQNRRVGEGEPPGGDTQAAAKRIAVQRDTGGRCEQVVQMVAGDVERAGDGRQAERAAQVRLDIVDRLRGGADFAGQGASLLFRGSLLAFFPDV